MDATFKPPVFQSIVEASTIAHIVINSVGKIEYLNTCAEEIFYYSKKELSGREIVTLFPQRCHSGFWAFLQTFILQSGKLKTATNNELYALRKDGTEFLVEVGISFVGNDTEDSLLLLTFIDKTEREKASEQFRLVVESAPNAIILVDYSGRIIMVNKQTEILFGYRRNELIGERMEIFVPKRLKKRHPTLRQHFYNNSHARPMGAGRDLYGLMKDGTEVPIEIGLNPIEKDGTHFVLASIIDITERKKTEDAIRLYTKRIEAKNKELEQFTYIASHDLREPLNSISSLIELFVENESHSLDKEALKQLEYIAKSSTRMKELVKGLLDYARLGKNAEFKETDLNQIVELAKDDLELSIKDAGAEIEIQKLPVLNVLEIEIRLLFQNLISNAIKYRNPGVAPKIKISANKVKGGWRFAVEDNGIGIPSNQKEKIFIIFQRLHGRNEYEGIGIGLSHCRKIVELHDGKIWVDSELNNGSTFYFFIPIK